MANIFRSNGTNYFQDAIGYGYFNKVEAVLYKSENYATELVKEALWGLSNLVCESVHITK